MLTGFKRITGPEVEPLSVSQAKAFLRVDHSDEDDLITALVKAAREQAEEMTRRAFLTQTWQGTADSIPTEGIDLPRPLFQSVEALSYLDDAGSSNAWTDYRVNPLEYPAVLTLTDSPDDIDQSRSDAWTVEWKAGFGDDAGDVPQAIVAAIKLLVAHLYEHRGEEAAPMPETVRLLLDPYKLPHRI